MIFKRLLTIGAFLVLSVHAQAGTQQEEDCAAYAQAQRHIGWQDICYTSDDNPQPVTYTPDRSVTVTSALDAFERAGGRAQVRTDQLMDIAYPGYADEPRDRYVTYEEAAREEKQERESTEEWLKREYPYFYKEHKQKMASDRNYRNLQEEYEATYDDGTGSFVPPFLKYLDYGFTVETDRKPSFYIDGVFPIMQTEDKTHTLINQDHISVTKGEDRSYSVGLGYRYYAGAYPYIAGVNLFYDASENLEHYRMGYGTELFTDHVELRANAYKAMSDARIVGRQDLGDGERVLNFEQAVDGFDLELGTGVPFLPMAKIFGGFERYDLKHADDLQSWTTRLEVKPLRMMTLNLEYINPRGDTDDSRIRFDGRVNFPFSSFDPQDIVEDFKQDYDRPATRKLIDRLEDRIERNNRVTTERWSESSVNIVPIPVGSGGDIQIQLIWDTDSDMDLHINLPAGTPSHVYYAQKESYIGSDLFASLDVDDIPLASHDPHPGRNHVENIFITSGMAVAGNYEAFVHAYDLVTNTSCTINVFVGGQFVSTHQHTFTATNQEFDLPTLVYP